jgi:hypothetical protein
MLYLNQETFPYQLLSDYAHILTKDKVIRAWLMQVVERCSRMFFYFLKSSVNKISAEQ